MTKKQYALPFSEGYGASTTGCHTKEEALEAFHRLAEEELDDSWKYITIDQVIETRYYKHKKCDRYTIGESDACVDCAEPHNSNGRKTFAVYL